MIPAYSVDYLDSARSVLGGMLLAGTYRFNLSADEFWNAFIDTGYASRFAAGESAILAGMSGWELAVRVMEASGRHFERKRPVETDALPPPYWAGWILAKYQWRTSFSFERINRVVPISSVIDMYHPYHEMDESRFFEELNRRWQEHFPDTNLRRLRKASGLSRQELARIANVSPRMIAKYEQREKSINHAQADVVQRLAIMLHVNVVDLLEVS